MSDDMFAELRQFLSENGIYYVDDVPLRHRTYFKSGGNCEIFAAPSSISQIAALVRFTNLRHIEYKLVGATSNLMFVDELEYGLIVSTKNILDVNVAPGGRISVGAGYSLEELVRVALINGLTGLEGLEGIPGTVGGAVVMNAGAYGYAISDHLVSMQCVDENGEIVILPRDECGFDYRRSIFKELSKLVIVSVDFRLGSADRRAIAGKIETFHIARHSYQEFAFPSLGSAYSVPGDFYAEIFASSAVYRRLCVAIKLFFKNPVAKFVLRKRPTNRYLNWLGRRRLQLDPGAAVSHKSMNILINDGIAGFSAKAAYLGAIRTHLRAEIPIENEIVVSALRSRKDLALAELLLQNVPEGVVSKRVAAQVDS